MDDFDLRSESDLRRLGITSGSIWLRLMKKNPNGRLQGTNPIAYVAKVERYEKLNAKRQDRSWNRHQEPYRRHSRLVRALEEDPLETLLREEERERARSAISRLASDEGELLRLKLGLGDEKPHTHAEISKIKGFSRQTIDKGYKKIVSKLRPMMFDAIEERKPHASS